MRRFELHRDEDPTGTSGTGVIAQGVEFDPTPAEAATGNRKVALQWMTEWPTTVVLHDRGIESVLVLHGHGGKTRLIWLD